MRGQVYVITSATDGLGFALAQLLVDQGAEVVLSASDSELLAATVSTIGGYDHAVGIVGEISDPATPERLTAAAAARFGRLDGCVLSAHAAPTGPILSVSDTQWQEAFDQHVVGLLRIARATATTMGTTGPTLPTDSGGSIVFALSGGTNAAWPTAAVSHTLDRALGAAIKDLADSLGPRGIRVNGIAPGRMSAAPNSAAPSPSRASQERVRMRHEAEIPLGRYGEPGEFASAAAFLLSPMASYVSGTILTVDGGSSRL